jgi:2-polyprenyl-3-methyl-5-hydroxy-6-metoxy-1,4-benzoquinol methylase
LSYQDRTIDSPSRLKRFSHRKRFQIATELISPLASENILDFGAGDGYFLRKLSIANPNSHLTGYEPHGDPSLRLYKWQDQFPNIRMVDTLIGLTPGSFHKVSCLEVIEHLLEEELKEALKSIRLLVHQSGKVVISVPIEIHGAAIVKYGVRRALGQLEPGMTIGTTLKCALGFRIDRHREATSYGHTGFDYRQLENQFKISGFHIDSRLFSPFPALKGTVNSQLFYTLRKRSSE